MRDRIAKPDQQSAMMDSLLNCKMTHLESTIIVRLKTDIKGELGTGQDDRTTTVIDVPVRSGFARNSDNWSTVTDLVVDHCLTTTLNREAELWRSTGDDDAAGVGDDLSVENGAS